MRVAVVKGTGAEAAALRVERRRFRKLRVGRARTESFIRLSHRVRDIVGGRSQAYEDILREGRESAIREMTAQAGALGANAVIGVDLDYETVGANGSMLMVTASGTAVRV